MKLGELINELKKLEQDSEIGIIISDKENKIFEIISLEKEEIVAGEYNCYYFEKELDFTGIIK